MKNSRVKIKDEVIGSFEAVKYGNGFQIRFDLEEETRDGVDLVMYNYINVDALIKSQVKSAYIKQFYPTYDKELACINNGGAGYEEYQKVRADAEALCKELGL